MPQVQQISNTQGAFGYQAQVGQEIEDYISAGCYTTDAATTALNATLIHSTAGGFTPDDVGGIVMYTTLPSTSAPYISVITAVNSTVITVRDAVSATSGAVAAATLLRQLTPGMPVVAVNNSTALFAGSSQAGGSTALATVARAVTAQVVPTTFIGSAAGPQIAGVVLVREAPGTYQTGSVPASTVVGAGLLAPTGGTVRVLRSGSMVAAASSVGATVGAAPSLHVSSSVPLSASGLTLSMSSATAGCAAGTTAVGSTGLLPGYILGALNSTIAVNTTWFTQGANAFVDLR